MTSERQQIEKERGTQAANHAAASEKILYKIEIPANRYDLLCVEGLSRALRIFLHKEQPPKFTLQAAREKLTVAASVKSVRPFAVAAVLRNVSFTEAAYDSFIALQDKLHSTIGRKRSLVSMGTHDLDSIKGPFRYEARAPAEIAFCPLKETAVFRADALIEHYEKDLYLRTFVPLIADSPVFPVMCEASGEIMSLPPIINSAKSRITPATRNIFIDVTATDLTKALVVLDVLCASFSQYCGEKHGIERVVVEYENEPAIVERFGSTTVAFPLFETRIEAVAVDYINSSIGTQMEPQTVQHVLAKMGLESDFEDAEKKRLLVRVPPYRSDILHACDVMEDAAIGFGFNRITKTMPQTSTIGAEFALNKISDALRREVALCGFAEVLTLTLCSKNENYAHLNRPFAADAVQLANPQTVEFEIVRTSLLPGVLKTVASNRFMPLPIKIFEVADVVLLDAAADTHASNQRRLVVLIADTSSCLELLHGVVDRVMVMLGVRRTTDAANSANESRGFCTRPSHDPAFFPGRQAEIFLGAKRIGVFGIVHPDALAAFDIPFVASAIELEIEHFL